LFIFTHQTDNQWHRFGLKKYPLNSPTGLQAQEFGRAYQVRSKPTNPAKKRVCFPINSGV